MLKNISGVLEKYEKVLLVYVIFSFDFILNIFSLLYKSFFLAEMRARLKYKNFDEDRGLNTNRIKYMLEFFKEKDISYLIKENADRTREKNNLTFPSYFVLSFLIEIRII